MLTFKSASQLFKPPYSVVSTFLVLPKRKQRNREFKVQATGHTAVKSLSRPPSAVAEFMHGGCGCSLLPTFQVCP